MHFIYAPVLSGYVCYSPPSVVKPLRKWPLRDEIAACVLPVEHNIREAIEEGLSGPFLLRLF